jgi:polar amino acid transport system substrate-binding protein
MMFLVLCCTFFPNTTRAEDELVIAVGLAKPPYVIQSDNSGFELDLIRHIVKKMGKSTQFIYTQYGHSSKMLEVKEVDAVMTTNKSVFTDTTKLSDEYITYQNVAISLKKNNLVINSIEDLANYTIASFQKADKVLGQSFASAVDKSPLYMKIADQSQQPMLLLKNRVEVLIMDINIFVYFTRQLGVNDTNTMFTYHPIFPKTNYRIAFKNKDNVKVFNEVLAQYKQTHEYLQLKQNYNL